MIWVRRGLYFMVAFILGAGVFFALFHKLGLFEVKGIPIEMVTDDGEVNAAPATAVVGLKDRLTQAISGFSGKKIWEVDLGKIRASLIKDEWVRDVLISRSLPNQIRIQVKPKRAVAVLVSNKGDFLPVTSDGSVLKPLAPGILPDVPILRGEIFARESERRLEAVKFIASLNSNGPLSLNNVSEVSWNTNDGYALILMEPKVDVRLGDENLDIKTLRVSQVLNYLSANNLKGRVIDASFSKKVLVRLRKAP